jgi:hypothetical protein
MGVMSFQHLLKICLLAGLFSNPLQAQVQFESVVVDSAGSSPAKPYGKVMRDINGDGQPDLFI